MKIPFGEPPAQRWRETISAVQAAAVPLTGAPNDFDALIALIGDARFVLLGEASHGTHEFYRVRAAITKRLITECGFAAVAVEADWPDAYRVNRYIRGESDDLTATDALGGFKRFPQWMWRNADVLDFVGWLRTHNETRPVEERVGFYGLDLYSLHASIEAVISYLRRTDPEAALRAVARYACFDHYGGDPQAYGYATSLGLSATCETEVVRQLMELRDSSATYLAHDGRLARDEQFFAEQNARVVKNAELYYRTMFGSRVESWNLRDQHMTGTLEALAEWLPTVRSPSAAPARMVVWAHNSHLGDARATEMGARGELNVGQLTRERWPTETFLLGFTTHSGSVTAASDWDMAAEHMTVREAMAGSCELLFHEARASNFLLPLREPSGTRPTAGGASTPLADVMRLLDAPLLQRAIGVIYRPRTERLSHYFRTRLSRQFDAVLHYDRTRAVEPLERSPEWERGHVPETFPSTL